MEVAVQEGGMEVMVQVVQALVVVEISSRRHERERS